MGSIILRLFYYIQSQLALYSLQLFTLSHNNLNIFFASLKLVLGHDLLFFLFFCNVS